MKSSNDIKKQLFENMKRVDKTFKPKLNEDVNQPVTQNDEFLPITTPIGSQDDKLFVDIVNKGIDSHLEGFVKSKFNRRVFDFHKTEIPILLRRLEEIGTEEALQWKDDIENYNNNLTEIQTNITETGEWSGDEDDVAWMEELRSVINTIATETGGKLQLIDIKGFDKYQGPYAVVRIDGKQYKVWTMEEYGNLWIEGFPYDNTSGEGTKGGFQGNIEDIVNIINNTGSAPRNQMYHGSSLNQ